jgi:hypothetical protein
VAESTSHLPINPHVMARTREKKKLCQTDGPEFSLSQSFVAKKI